MYDPQLLEEYFPTTITTPPPQSVSVNDSELSAKGFNIKDNDILAEILITLKGGTACASYDKNEDCPICFASMKNTYTITHVCDQHTFHRSCVLLNIIQSKRYVCPCCII